MLNRFCPLSKPPFPMTPVLKAGPRVPFVVSCCTFLKSIFLQTLNKIISTLLSMESKTTILYVNMNFTGNLFLGFSRYCDKLYLESTVFHLFLCLHLQGMFLKFFFTLPLSK